MLSIKGWRNAKRVELVICETAMKDSECLFTSFTAEGIVLQRTICRRGVDVVDCNTATQNNAAVSDLSYALQVFLCDGPEVDVRGPVCGFKAWSVGSMEKRLREKSLSGRSRRFPPHINIFS